MKAAEYHRHGDIRIVDIPVPEIGQEEILVKTKVCGVCGSDVLKWYREKKKSISFGHEVSGIVAKIGKKVEGFQKGDRVFVHHHVPCYICQYCRKGYYTMCAMFHQTNIDPRGFAEYIRVPMLNVRQGGVIKLPDNVSFEAASLIEPIACCVRGLKKTNLQMQDTVLIIGAGFSGLAHLQLVKMMGAGLVVVTDFFDFKLKKAKMLGADFTINPSCQKVKEKLYQINEGKGADLVVVTPASTKTIKEAIDLVGKGGTLYLFGPTSPEDYVSIFPFTFFFSEINLITTYSASPLETHAVCKLLKEKKINAQELITHRFSIDKIEEAVELATKAEESLKVVIEFE